MRLDGKTALVTGAGRGLGLAYCQRLATDGANVVAVDIEDPIEAVAALGGDGDKLGLICDVGRAEDISRVKEQVADRFGRCDILVNNAAIFPTSTLESMTIGLWRHVQAVNVESILLLVQAFAGGMQAAKWGRIVNTGSANTLMQGRDLAYMTSKGSVHAITRALANELGESGITVNAIAPSVVATAGFSARGRSDGPSADAVLAHVSSMQTIRRPSTPIDLANALAFLVSDDAGFITGQILHVDGGLTRTGA